MSTLGPEEARSSLKNEQIAKTKSKESAQKRHPRVFIVVVVFS